ncbi:lipoprotein [Fictibacillus macauensis ZFHKF-1]|uniref:Lipoprotein n=1 Tax=Fictibacillus macauensis ZFHKF-1 TaxID=1196324 RepID=I8UCD3_9BACL|nr:YdhK family protein [Fictibacillus macauensis]EIT84443.1 lipoprotein [Fictibacillus macauensis ZFHKF-1]
MKKAILLWSVAFTLTLAGCNKGNDDNKKHEEKKEMNHGNMKMDEGVPKGLKEEANPTYKKGSKVIIKEGHMKGMKDAEATVKGAYKANVYGVTYTPTDGGAKVVNHKWVIQQDLKDPGDKLLKKGTKVTLEADHMKGMKGAKGVIEEAKSTTIYMVDYQPTTGGKKVMNHKWLTEDELKKK